MLSQGPYAYLPGGEILESGLRDLELARATLPALLLAMAWPRLGQLGLVTRAMVERVRVVDEDLEISAYRMLARELGVDAHARFLALSAELESSINALEREQRRKKAHG